MAEYLYSSLSPTEQRMLERAALSPSSTSASWDHSAPCRWPTSCSSLATASTAPPRAAIRPRFAVSSSTASPNVLGAGGLADARRELAARARATGANALAVQVLLEGDLTAEAVELADREVEALRNANRLDEARRLVRLLPAASLAEHPHLQELAAWPLLEEPLDVRRVPARWRVNRRLFGAALSLMLLVGPVGVPPPEGLSVRGWHAVLMLVGRPAACWCSRSCPTASSPCCWRRAGSSAA